MPNPSSFSGTSATRPGCVKRLVPMPTAAAINCLWSRRVPVARGWSEVSVLPSDAEGNGTVAAILAVSCLPGEHCVAVGNYLDGNGNQRALVENLSAGSWTPSEAPLPSGITVDPSGSLSGVSCSISTAGAAPTATRPRPSRARPPTTTTSSTSTPTPAAPPPRRAAPSHHSTPPQPRRHRPPPPPPHHNHIDPSGGEPHDDLMHHRRLLSGCERSDPRRARYGSSRSGHEFGPPEP